MNHSNLNPAHYEIGRANQEQTAPKPTPFKRKGDFNSNFTLFIKYKKAVSMFDRTTARDEEVSSYTFYSKMEGIAEPNTAQALSKFYQLIETAVRQRGGIQYAAVYYNLNRGRRINKFWELTQNLIKIPYKPENAIRNIQLLYFDRQGQQRHTIGNKIYHLPRIHADTLNTPYLNQYYNDLANLEDRGVSETHRKVIWHYFNSCYNTHQVNHAPQLVATTHQPHEELTDMQKVQIEPLQPKPKVSQLTLENLINEGFTKEEATIYLNKIRK